MPFYRPQNYGLYDRAWSILLHLYLELPKFSHVAEYVEIKFSWRDVRETNFMPRLATAENLLPIFTAEFKSAVPGKVAGRRMETWEVAIRVSGDSDIRSRGLNADIFAMMDDVIEILDGATVPYYQYSLFPVDYEGTSLHESYRVSARDFTLKWVGSSRGSEIDERDRDSVRMLFQCEV